MKSAEDRLFANGYDSLKLLYGFDTALIGVTTEGAAVYDYDLMICWLIENESMDHDEAVSWLEENTLGALPNMGEDHPIVMERLADVNIKTGEDDGSGQ